MHDSIADARCQQRTHGALFQKLASRVAGVPQKRVLFQFALNTITALLRLAVLQLCLRLRALFSFLMQIGIRQYQGWSGMLGATEPGMGAISMSEAAATGRCEKQLGTDWRYGGIS